MCISGLDWDKKIGPGIFWFRRPTTTSIYILLIYSLSLYIYIYIWYKLPVKSFWTVRFLCFLNNSLSVHLFYAKYRKSSNIKIFFFWNIFKIVIYSYDFKAEFSALLLKSHDPSEIIQIFCFAALKTYYYYVENHWIYFFQVSLKNRKWDTVTMIIVRHIEIKYCGRAIINLKA